MPVCNAPAQDLLTLREMRSFAAGAPLPEDFAFRAAVAAEARELHTSPNVHYWHASPHPLTDLISFDELDAFVAGGGLPADLRERAVRVSADDICVNCDGQRCMGCVLRDVDHLCPQPCRHCQP